MTWFERIKRFYDRKLWTIGQVRDGVVAGVISADEFKLITGIDYEGS